MNFVNKRMIVTINKLSIELTGGQSFSGSNNMISGSSLGFVNRIKSNKIFGKTEFPSIYHMAAAYLCYILKNHCFVDGNKRTALATAVTFLQWNNILFSPFDTDKVFTEMIEYTRSEKTPSELIPTVADWLEGMSLH